MLRVCIIANAIQWETISAPVTLVEVTVTYHPYRMKDLFYIITTNVQINGPDLNRSVVPPFHSEYVKLKMDAVTLKIKSMSNG